jgi:hypothetical protein
MEVTVVEEKETSTTKPIEAAENNLVEVDKSIEITQIGGSSEEITNQNEHIESIRRRYGIGIELNEQSKTVTDSLKGVIGRSLESLSHELYNKGNFFKRLFLI